MAFKQLFTLGDFYHSDFLLPGEPLPEKTELGLSLDEDTGLVRLTTLTPPEKMFGKYWYRSGTNATMRGELKGIVDEVMSRIELKAGDIWIDLASNDGTLLSFVPKSVYRIGIDPADNSFKEEAQKHADEIIQEFFPTDKLVLNKKAKVITCIAMFYDVLDQDSFLKSIYSNLADDGVFVVQMSYTPLMYEQLAFDNIVPEHAFYYTFHSLKCLLARNGLVTVDCQLNDTNGGSFRVYAMKTPSYGGNIKKFSTAPNRDVCEFRMRSLISFEQKLELYTPAAWQVFFNRISKLKDRVRNFIEQAKNENKTVYGYAASTKANTLLQYFGLDNTSITAIAERNPRKWGRVTPGTNIPIVSEQEFRDANPHYCLILAWHFISEFKDREQAYLNNGGSFIVPCPRFEVITK